MDLSEAVNNRRTIRKFLPEPISADLVKKLINNARWAPSWGNTQPCEFVVATGTAVKTLREENRKALMAGIQSTPDFKMPETWPPHLKLRYIDVGKSVLTSLEIAREDQQGRLDYYGDMFSLFEAPALLVVLIDKTLIRSMRFWMSVFSYRHLCCWRMQRDWARPHWPLRSITRTLSADFCQYLLIKNWSSVLPLAGLILRLRSTVLNATGRPSKI